MTKTPQAGGETQMQPLEVINGLIFSARPTCADTRTQTNVSLSLTPLNDTKVYVSVLVNSEDIFGLSNKTTHRTATVTIPEDCSFASLVQKLRAEMNPTFQHTFGSSVRMEFSI